MNTLNNIHALIDIDTTQAQEAVIKLSKLMRHVLTKSQNGTASIREEFDFLISYIDLMRLRFSKKVKITVQLDVDHDNQQIPSLLFVSLVENVFKYGVSYSKPSEIFIGAEIIDHQLYFKTKNNKTSELPMEQGTGVGLVNLRKQLDLIYGKNYTLQINETENEYNVQLQIPLNDD